MVMGMVVRSPGAGRTEAAAGHAGVSVGAGVRSLPDLPEAKSGWSRFRKAGVSRMPEP
jgi:hypothetical protein